MKPALLLLSCFSRVDSVQPHRRPINSSDVSNMIKEGRLKGIGWEQKRECWQVDPGSEKRKEHLIPYQGFPVKAPACNVGDLGSIPGLGRSPREGNSNRLQYSCLENPMDGGAWWATVHGLQSPTRLSDFTFVHPEESIPLRTRLFILAARLVSRQQNKGVKLCRGEVSLSFLPLTLWNPLCRPPKHQPRSGYAAVTSAGPPSAPTPRNPLPPDNGDHPRQMRAPDEHQGYRIADAGMAWDSDRII